jgi:hypothetical protein
MKENELAIFSLTEDGQLSTQLKCSPSQAMNMAYTLLNVVSREMGVEYNDLVEDLKEIKEEE